jgi:hypothetical protein
VSSVTSCIEFSGYTATGQKSYCRENNARLNRAEAPNKSKKKKKYMSKNPQSNMPNSCGTERDNFVYSYSNEKLNNATNITWSE